MAHGKEAVEKTGGDRDAVRELANAWGRYMPAWKEYRRRLNSSGMEL